MQQQSPVLPTLVGARVTLRQGFPEDVPALVQVRREPSVWRWWRDVDSDDVAADLRAENGDHLLVIEVDGHLVGGIQYGEELEPDYKHASIDIFLSRSAQGRGLGAESIRLLARYLIEQRGHHRLVIDPASDNEAAIKCYRSVGFQTVGVMRQYERRTDGGFHDGLLMDLLATELQ